MEDARAIHRILNYYGGRNFLLPRSLSEIYDHLRDYFVLEKDDQRGSVGGVCGLGICWEDLAEIRSLAIDDNLQGKGYGSRLVEACLHEARLYRLKRVFVLTYIPDFFARFGFREVEKALLPHKIWADCVKCPKFPDCDETALMFEV